MINCIWSSICQKERGRRRKDNGSIFFSSYYVDRKINVKNNKLIMIFTSLLPGTNPEARGAKKQKSKDGCRSSDDQQHLFHPILSSSVNPRESGH
jgi:hypothetical protein